ncbi:hypothetical protein XBLMG947_4164 [Xanthomonas bromi]|uniref:Uncharacterized protein n=1 Tax=Xanthomonas bromi TaxID=56449 RepID=A0A1C3NSL7_9XANT|nr:M23 family metallopeptidase [Xanthomonas bromi]SBV53334.1 hypothetical protein XBLMG947_4164 [Xanthomonas bromi]
MLISYPILPANAANQSDQAKFDAMVALTQPTRGLYPITTGNRWHGGIHLTPGTEPIRAIADGVIVAYRLAPATKDYPGQGLYDTSFVLIKHDTHSGENTQVVYYSLYMHLAPKGSLTDAQRSQMMPFLRNAATGESATQAPANTRVWRKEVLGFGGQLYGVPTVHFEIFTTEADLARFWRDASAVAAGGHGSNDVFGDTHFILPANLNFVARHPHAVAPHRLDLPNQNEFFNLPVGAAGQNSEHLHIVVELKAGRRIATTYRLNAQGRITTQVGLPVDQDDYEYDLFRIATALYTDRPSAGFEYLRYGRILNGETTARIENWQLIRYTEDAIGYINLADPGHHIAVLSDADFPLYWQKLEEGQTASPTDGIANVDVLTQLLNLPASPTEPSLSSPPSFASRASDAVVAKQLQHFICKHPSEWDSSDLDARYSTLKQPGQLLSEAAAWKNFKDHVDAMTFWSQSGLADRSVWHFHPLSFIKHFRKCGWLTARELARTIPNRPGYSANGAVRTALNTGRISMANALQRTANYITPLNQVMRKYGIAATRIRQTQFLAQVMLETDKWQTMTEYGHGAANTRLPMTQYYLAFYGRGIMQLTWAGNYDSYGAYRNFAHFNGPYQDARITGTSTHYWGDPTLRDAHGRIIGLDPNKPPRRWADRYDPATIEQSPYNSCDSGGHYWVSKRHNGEYNINRVADRVFSAESIGRTSVLVNGGGNGYYERQAYARYAYRILGDDPASATTERHSAARNNVTMVVDYTTPTE